MPKGARSPAALVSAGAPILCLDTCTILDIMRDLTRDTTKAHEARAAQAVIAAMESGRALGMVAAQVEAEISDNRQKVEDEATQNLTAMRNRLRRMDEVAALFGSVGFTSIDHMDGYCVSARGWMDRLLNAAIRVKPSAAVAQKANLRSIQGRAPAPKGQGGIKDCLVFETYLELGRKLQAVGLAQPLVLVSSNTSDYGSTGTPKPEIQADVSSVNMDFYSSLSAARHSLGI